MKNFFAVLFALVSFASFAQCDLHVEQLESALRGDRALALELKDLAMKRGYSLHPDTSFVQNGDFVVTGMWREVRGHGIYGLVPTNSDFTYMGGRMSGFRFNGPVILSKKSNDQIEDIKAVNISGYYGKGSHGSILTIVRDSMIQFLKRIPKCSLLPKE